MIVKAKEQPSAIAATIAACLAIAACLLAAAGLSACSPVAGGLVSTSSYPSDSSEGSPDAMPDSVAEADGVIETSRSIDLAEKVENGDVPVSSGYTQESLIAEGDPILYTFDDLSADVEQLARRYPQWVFVDSLGTTVDHRDIYHLVIGNPNAEDQILVHAGIHAREYYTTQLVMKQAAAFLSHAEAGESYGASSYEDALRNCAVHLVPSVNPDGAAISQFGLEGIRDEAARQRVMEIAQLDGAYDNDDYLTQWKANANGVDLNRNFDALWDEFDGSPHPSSERYKGERPGSEVEARALIELTEKQGFSRTISYHTHGSVIYWYFGQGEPLYSDTEQFAERVSEQTGYSLDANFAVLDPAGYKDWALSKMGIPSLTIEVGWGPTPVPAEQFESIWQQNEHIWEIALDM